jgi:protein-tyrosine phosphatase
MSRSRIPVPYGMGELWMGGYPWPDDDLSEFDLVVSALSDGEPQFRAHLRIPLSDWDQELDDPLKADMVRTAAATVAHALQDGRRVLVHCGAGLNRSGVVTARAMMYLGIYPDQAIAIMREARSPDVLFNQGFVRWLNRESGVDDTPMSAEEAEEQK